MILHIREEKWKKGDSYENEAKTSRTCFMQKTEHKTRVLKRKGENSETSKG